MKKTKAAIYCRVSPYSDPETLDYLCNLQKHILMEKAAESHFDVTEYYLDVGYSGSDMKRPALQKMLQDHSDGKFEIVLVCNSDRLLKGNPEIIVDWPFPVLSANRISDFNRSSKKIARYMRSASTNDKSIVKQRRAVRRTVQKLGYRKRWR